MGTDPKERFAGLKKLETPRLLLRRITVEDLEDVFDYAHDPRTSEYLLWSPHETKFFTRNYLQYLQKAYAKGTFQDFAVVWKENGKMIGTAGYTTIDERHSRAEIGYVLHPDYWGMGIAAEAAEELLAFGFREMGLHRIEAHYMVENTRSRRVMEKCGMHFEGVLQESMFVKGAYRDIGICAILQEEYDAVHPEKREFEYEDRSTHWYDRLRENGGR